MKKRFTFLIAALMLLMMIVIPGKVVGQTKTSTYQHVFNAKPSTGNNVTLSSVYWNITATNLGNYNSSNYAGVQLGSKNSNGSIRLTSSNEWGGQSGDYNGKTKITKVRLWLNLGGTSITPSVTIGGRAATSDGTTVVKNSSAGSDWTQTTCVTFTPASGGDSGTVVINVSTVKAGYICCLEIDCEEASSYEITARSNNDSWGTVELSSSTITATPSTGYRVNTTTPYTVSPANSATVVQNDNTFTVTPSDNTTVTINFEAIPTYTVTLWDNNATLTETIGGAGVTLPSRDDIGDYEFQGWSTTNASSVTTTAPTIIPVGTYHPTGNITLYPVYSRTEGESTEETVSTTIAAYASANSWVSGTAYTSIIMDENVTITGKDNGNNSKYYSTDPGTWRHYATNSGEITVSTSSGTLKEVTITYSGNTLQCSGSDVVSGVAIDFSDASSASAVFAVTGTSGNTQVSAIDVTYTVSGSSTTYYWSSPVVYSVDAPTFNIPAGTYTEAQTVTITCETPNSSIYYTTNGDDPTDSSEPYPTATGITVSVTTTIKAIAYVSSDASAVATATYTITPYSVNYKSNGIDNIVYQENTEFSLAAPDNVPTGFTFEGWTMVGEGDIDVTSLLSGESVNLSDYETDHATLVAVFSGEVDAIPAVPAIPGRFEKVTEELDDWSGTYLIVFDGISNPSNDYAYPKAFNGSLSNLDVSLNITDVTIKSGKIEATETLLTKVFTIANDYSDDEDHPYTIKSASGYYIGHNGSGNGFSSSTTDKYGNSIQYDNDGERIVIKGSGDIQLQYYWGGAQSRFKYYSSNQRDIQLYKYIEGTPGVPAVNGTTARFIRVFQNETAEGDVTISGPSIIPSGKYLDMGTNTLTNNKGAANLVIEDGGQLFCNNSVNATVKKGIKAYSTGSGNTDGWYFIASPISTAITPSNLITDGLGSEATAETATYDLYKLDVTKDKGWQNYRQESFSFTNGMGYLYANKNNTIVNFSGAIKPYSTADNANQVTLAHDGWNLIGNPFTCMVSVNRPFSVVNGGSSLTPKESGQTIMPCVGIAIQGNEGDVVTFTQTTTANSPGNNGNVQIALAQNVVTRGESKSQTIDNAIVSFNEGSQLGKFYFGKQDANLYIPMDNEEYAIVSSSTQGEMPVNFKAHRDGQYTITVNPQEVEMGYLHLIDNIGGMDIDLLATPSYTFNAKADDYESRFRLVFSANMVNADLNDDFAFFSNGLLVIANEGESILQVIDVNGRIVATESVNGTCSKAINVKAGVYVLRLINGENVKTQKIIVK